MRRFGYALGVCAVVSGMVCVTLPSRPAQAEVYVAGQVGVTLPQNLTNVQYTAGGVTVGGNDLALQNSLMYGAKAGYYFDSLKWLGLETEVFNTNPNIKQQNFTIGGVDLGTGP